MKTFEQLSDEIYTVLNPKVNFTLGLARKTYEKGVSAYSVDFQTSFSLRDGRNISQNGEGYGGYGEALWVAFDKIRKQLVSFKSEPAIGKDEDTILGEIIARVQGITSS